MIREREDLKTRFENGVVPEQTAEKAIKRAIEDGLIIVETVEGRKSTNFLKINRGQTGWKR